MSVLPQSILVVRRDNIGDLVCTTPLFSALRSHYPNACIAALVNSYNAPVLAGNPDVDEIWIYQKHKHAGAQGRLKTWLATWQLMRVLRARKFDLMIIATPAYHPSGLKFARWIRPRRLIAYGPDAIDRGDFLALPYAFPGHETEAVIQLLKPLGIVEKPGPLHVYGLPAERERISLPPGNGPLIALHISARKASQRWPIERFAELAHLLHDQCAARFLLFWSPGDDSNPLHPGDDGKAAQLLAHCRDLPVMPCPSTRLEELIGGLSLVDFMICSDGGAMHLAAGLGKPILCFFGNSSARHWGPWGVPNELLQPASLDVFDISIAEAYEAFGRLQDKLNNVLVRL